MIPAVRVVVHPLEPGMAMDLAPRELTLTVRLEPELVVVVVYHMRSLVTGVTRADAVVQVCAVADPEVSLQANVAATLCWEAV
jgi:hypothetical protein